MPVSGAPSPVARVDERALGFQVILESRGKEGDKLRDTPKFCSGTEDQAPGEVHKFLLQSSLLPSRTIRLISIDALVQASS